MLRLATEDSLLIPAHELRLLGAHNNQCIGGRDRNGGRGHSTGIDSRWPDQLSRTATSAGGTGQVRRRSVDQRFKGNQRCVDQSCVQSMTQPTILLLGGRHKGEPYTTLLPAIRQHVRHVIAYGEAAPEIVQDLSEQVSVELVDGSFEMS